MEASGDRPRHQAGERAGDARLVPTAAGEHQRPGGADATITQFYRDLTDRVQALPGVRSVGAVGDLPIADGNSIWSILIDGSPQMSVGDAPSAMPQQVTPGYFRTMGIPVLRGREFTAGGS